MLVYQRVILCHCVTNYPPKDCHLFLQQIPTKLLGLSQYIVQYLIFRQLYRVVPPNANKLVYNAIQV